MYIFRINNILIKNNKCKYCHNVQTIKVYCSYYRSTLNFDHFFLLYLNQGSSPCHGPSVELHCPPKCPLLPHLMPLFSGCEHSVPLRPQSVRHKNMGLAKKPKKKKHQPPPAHTCLHTATQFMSDEKTKLSFKAGIFLSVALELLAFSEAS